MYVNALTLLLFAFGTIPTAFGTSIYKYELSGIPKNESGCALTASDLASKFTATTGKTVFSSECLRETWSGYNIAINYVSAAPLELVSTALRYGDTSPQGFIGIFTTLDLCQQALVTDVDEFSMETGLAPFIAYCVKESPLNGTPFGIRIDAFGSASKSPGRFETGIFGAFMDDAIEIQQAIMTSANDAGIDAKRVTIANDGLDTLVIQYYDTPAQARERLYYFSLNEFGSYYSNSSDETKASCRQELGDAQARFSSHFTTPTTWFCVWDKMLFKARLYALRVKPSNSRLLNETAPGHYETYAACAADKDRVSLFYSQTLGKPVIGVSCDWNFDITDGRPDVYQIKVFVRSN